MSVASSPTSAPTALLTSGTTSAAATNTKHTTSSTFYLAHRKGVTFAREDPDGPLPKFNTLDEWGAAKSTKIDVCARLCRHILERDDALPIEFRDGQAIFPPTPSSDVPPSLKTKIIIYQEFPFFRPVLVNVSPLHQPTSLCRLFNSLPRCSNSMVSAACGSTGGPHMKSAQRQLQNSRRTRGVEFFFSQKLGQ